MKIIVAVLSLALISQVALADDSHKTYKKHGKKHENYISFGHFQTTEAGKAADLDISGRAMLVRRSDGVTEAYTHLTGLEPSSQYAVHVHDLPCSLGGGGHYKIDPNINGTEMDNEIWPAVSTDANGVGQGADRVEHFARPEAQSLVVHGADGTRIACSDLSSDYDGAVVTTGDMEPLAKGLSPGIVGRAQMVRSQGRTYATLTMMGLNADTAYGAHVHNLPCSLNQGGGHYKNDPSESATLEENEIWLSFSTDATGFGAASADVAYIARPEAQSVVVHAPDGSRLTCADLTPLPFTDMFTQGRFITTTVGTERGYTIEGSAKMVRTTSGKTMVFTNVNGLEGNTTYASHVHNLPCRLGGGGHYKIDPAISETVERNEIWPVLKTNRKGQAIGQAKVYHIARPEAQSIVIHDSDGSRLACSDLD